MAYADDIAVLFLQFLRALPGLRCVLEVIRHAAGFAAALRTTAVNPAWTSDVDQAKDDLLATSDAAAHMRVVCGVAWRRGLGDMAGAESVSPARSVVARLQSGGPLGVVAAAASVARPVDEDSLAWIARAYGARDVDRARRGVLRRPSAGPAHADGVGERFAVVVQCGSDVAKDG